MFDANYGSAAPPHFRSLREPWSVGDFFILAVPAMQFLQLQSFGVLYGTDLMLLAALPFLLARGGHRLGQRQVRLILLLGFFWLGGQIATDLYRETTAGDYLRGWSKIALTITHFAAIVILMRDSLRRFFLYGVGLCAGQVLTCLIAPNEYLKDAVWKNGYGVPVTLGATLLCAWLLRKRNGSPLLLGLALLLAAVNLLGDFRSLGVMCAAAGLYAFFLGRQVKRNHRTLRFALAIATIVLAVTAFKTAYEYAAGSGLLGAGGRHRLELAQGEGGILLGGRGEILASTQAVLDSPLLGHGSWAKDPQYFAMMQERRMELGYKNDVHTAQELIPSHSYFFGAWVESGILGAVFWAWVFLLSARTLWRARGSEPLFPAMVMIITLLLWDILFSPYGADCRFVATYYMTAMLMFRTYILHSGGEESESVQG